MFAGWFWVERPCCYNRGNVRSCGEGKMTLEFRCPRCGNPVRSNARFCATCGLDLMGAGLVPPPPAPAPAPLPMELQPQIAVPAPPLPYIPEGTAPNWVPTAAIPSVELPRVRNASVIAALTPTKPATAAFWVGLVLLILALVLVACPTLLAFALWVDPADQQAPGFFQGALGVSSCLFFGLLLPGMALVAVGRPRRQI